MSSLKHGYFIRGIEAPTMERLRIYAIDQRGTFVDVQGELITNAIEEFLDKRLPTTAARHAIVARERDPRVMTKIAQLQGVFKSFYDGQEWMGELSLEELERRLMDAGIKDRRTRTKYIQELGIDGYVEYTGRGSIYKVNMEWLKK